MVHHAWRPGMLKVATITALLWKLVLHIRISVAHSQGTCVAGNTVNLVLGLRSNTSGHTVVNGRLDQTLQGSWTLNINVDTASCSAGVPRGKALSFELTDASPVRGVPPGYRLLPGMGYYRGSTQALPWEAAKQACAREGAVLAFASSQEEALRLANDFNFKVPGSDFQHLAWYGASDIAEEGKFVAVTGVPLDNTGYGTMPPPEPNGGKGENCVLIVKETGFLGDGACVVRLAFVCKVAL